MVRDSRERRDARRDKILDRVKKLLALSSSNNVHEAANAAVAAQRLMSAHQLTEKDISDLQEGQMFELSMGVEGFASRWKFVLVTAVSRAFFCEAVGLRAGSRRKVKIVGRKADVEIAARMFRYLHAEINRLAEIEIEAIEWDDWNLCEAISGTGKIWEIGTDTEQYLESFRRGAVVAVIAKFRGNEKEFVASDSRSLVISKRDQDHVRDYVRTRFATIRKPDRDAEPVQIDDLAFVRGYEQARQIVLPGDGGFPIAGGGRKGKSTRRPTGFRPGAPGPGSPAEVFVKPVAGPVVDVVITHAGCVPLVPPGQRDAPEAGKFAGPAEPGTSSQSSSARVMGRTVKDLIDTSI